MPLDDLTDAGARVSELEAQLRSAMDHRNRLVADALAQGERAMTIAIALGVTPARVYQMRDRARQS